MIKQKDEGAEQAPVISGPVLFSKKQILKSKKYQPARNVLAVILKDDAQYSHEDVARELDKFMKEKVK